MTTHTLDNLDQSHGTLNGWVATCSCHNPDDEGGGRADFPGMTALEAVQAWQEHAAAQPDDLTHARIVSDVDGWTVMLSEYGPDDDHLVRITIDDGEDSSMSADLTDQAWNTLRGAR